MSCQKYESTINELAREQIMEMTVRTETLDHCAQCEQCAQSLKEQRSLTASLQSLAGELRNVGAAEMVPEELIVALKGGPTAPMIVKNRHWQYWLAAAAAALVLFFAIGAMRLRRSIVETPVNNTVQVKTTDQSPDPGKSASPLPSPENKEPKRRRVEKETKRARPVRPADRETVASNVRPSDTPSTTNYDTEIATEFLPLGYTQAMNLQDGGQIMRVEVPRSTLASFGLPINMNRAGERVKADLLVGMDGSARAIRFIQ
jgi:hypothetical protein